MRDLFLRSTFSRSDTAERTDLRPSLVNRCQPRVFVRIYTVAARAVVMSVSSVRALPPATFNWTCRHPSSHDQWGPEITDDPELAYFRPFALGGTNNHTDSDYPKSWTLNSLMYLNGAATRVLFSPPSFRLLDESLLALRTRSSVSPLHSAGPPVASLVLRVDEAEDGTMWMTWITRMVWTRRTTWTTWTTLAMLTKL